MRTAKYVIQRQPRSVLTTATPQTRYRGVLCNNCNTTGSCRDNTQILQSMIEYLSSQTISESIRISIQYSRSVKMAELHLEQIDRLAEILKEVDEYHPCFAEQSFLSISPRKMEKVLHGPNSYAMMAELIMMHPKMKCINIPE